MVKVHVWSEPPYWRLSLCSTPRNIVSEVTLPSFLMSFRAVSFSQMLAFCLQLWEIMHFNHRRGCYKSWKKKCIYFIKKIKNNNFTFLAIYIDRVRVCFSSMATTCSLVSPILLATVLKWILLLITIGYITEKGEKGYFFPLFPHTPDIFVQAQRHVCVKQTKKQRNKKNQTLLLYSNARHRFKLVSGGPTYLSRTSPLVIQHNEKGLLSQHPEIQQWNQ